MQQESLLKPILVKDSENNDKTVGYKNSFLDVGTRDGYTVEFMKSLGFENSQGAELFEDYVNYARSKGRNVQVGDIHDLPFEDSVFDIVYCRNTLSISA